MNDRTQTALEKLKAKKEKQRQKERKEKEQAKEKERIKAQREKEKEREKERLERLREKMENDFIKEQEKEIQRAEREKKREWEREWMRKNANNDKKVTNPIKAERAKNEIMNLQQFVPDEKTKMKLPAVIENDEKTMKIVESLREDYIRYGYIECRKKLLEVGYNWRDACSLIKYTTESFGDLKEYKTDDVKCSNLARLEYLYNKAMKDDNIKLALDIIKEINRIGGVYADADKPSTMKQTNYVFTFGNANNELPKTIQVETAEVVDE